MLIDLASKSDLTLCYEVPAGQWVASIDPASVYVNGQDYVQDKWVRRTRPDRTGGMPSPAQPSIKALLVDPIDCLRAVRTSTKQELFRRAYMITAEPFILAPDAPSIVTPSRMPLFSRDGKTTLDQSHCRFGLYPDDVEFTFRDEHGYRPPLEVELSVRTLSIAGSELKRYLDAMRDQSVRDVGGERGRETSGEHEIVDVEVTDVSVHAEPRSFAEIDPESARADGPVACAPQAETLSPTAERDELEAKQTDIRLPVGAAPGVTTLLKLADEYWAGKYEGKRWDKYQRIQQALLDLNDAKGRSGNGIIASGCGVTDSEWKAALAIIRPAWSIKNSTDPLKNEHELHITPELEAMISVAEQIHDTRHANGAVPDEDAIAGWLGARLAGRPLSANKRAVAIRVLMFKPE
ncbi:MAG: hypothetical protein ACLGHG_06885 [Gammaproteobacteria bacterium]